MLCVFDVGFVPAVGDQLIGEAAIGRYVGKDPPHLPDRGTTLVKLGTDRSERVSHALDSNAAGGCCRGPIPSLWASGCGYGRAGN